MTGIKSLVSALKAALRGARRVPFTVGVIATLWITGIATGSILSGPSPAVLDIVGGDLGSLRSGQWWAALTSIFFVTNPLAYVAATVVVGTLVPVAETAYGSLKAAALFFLGDFATVMVFFTVTQLARIGGDGWLGSMVEDPVLGPYPAAVFTAMAASPSLGVLWRRRLHTAVIGIAAMLTLYVGHSETVLGLMGALLGIVASWWSTRRRQDAHVVVPSVRERRNILVVIVTLAAVGPVLTALTRSPSGPLALVRDMVLNPLPVLTQLQQDCGGTVDPACLQAAQPTFLSPEGYLTSLVPMAILLVCAEGLRRGRIIALRLAIAVQLAVGTLAVGYLALFLRVRASPGRPRFSALASGFAHILPIALTAIALIVVLWLNRDLFPVQTARGMRRRLGAVAAVVAGGLVLAYTLLWWQSGGLGRRDSVWGLVGELVRQYLPAPIPRSYETLFRNRSEAELWLFTHSGLIVWLVGLVLVAVVVLRGRQSLGARDDSLHLARSLVRKGGGTLSWMTLWPPNQFWFDDHATAGLAFQLHGRVALSVAGPIGAPGRGPAAVVEFIGHCARNALVPCFYSLSADLWPVLRSRGFHRVEVAQETRLRVRELEFVGKEWQNVRTAVNKAGKLGVRAVWTRYHQLSPAQRQQLSALSEEWSAQKALPDMGFTLGGVDELNDPEVLLCLASDEQGRIRGVTSWLPVFEDSRVVGWTLDFMRRGPDSFPGVMEFLIASAVTELRSSVDWISLSGSPLAADPTGERAEVDAGDELLSRLLNAVGHALEPVYGFRSLAKFKSRFQPEYHALYMYYQDPLQLPAIGQALAQAYLPGLTMRHRMRILRQIVS
ncbi:bifunctional lysylphosphatidylglycerol flippase/synthetase MprF [Sinomonas sp. P10A9]|uniref:Bifunctional lysylphosphatidylglycerol flippase/synthetase MprF n=1 Tax=Sinomonas puerhi TaxID=3238584 RepID=A0AB39KZ41_9MICC